MIIYIDKEYKCHTTTDGNMAAVEANFFDGKCGTFIEGYRFIPSGESWAREDGVVFHGEMVAPWKDYSELEVAQREYEKQLLAEYQSTIADMESALNKLGVHLNESVD